MIYDLTELCEQYYTAYRASDEPYNSVITRAIQANITVQSAECPLSFAGLEGTERWCIASGIQAVILAIDPAAQFENKPAFKSYYIPDKAAFDVVKKKKKGKRIDECGNEFDD